MTEHSVRQKYEFSWDDLDVIVGGKSAIDSTQGFSVRGRDEADQYLRSYGGDLENPIDRAVAMGNFQESLSFIRRNFLKPDNPDGIRCEVPRKITELTDIRDLFLLASQGPDGPQASYLRSFACSILKVMHTVAHIDQDLRTPYFADIQKQILDRYYRAIHRDEDGRLFLGDRPDDPLRVDLEAFETKPKKTRESTLLKLLHKPENVAEDIFDRVGIRFVTKTRLDALRVVKFLKDRWLVTPSNIKPSRSRNTMVDIDDFRTQMQEVLAMSDRGELDESAAREKLEGAAHPASAPRDNRFSSEHYRAIQFTARQVIRWVHPLYDDFRELKRESKSGNLPENVQRLLDRMDLKFLQREVKFFYPYEVQIMDHEGFEESERGRSAHSEYKRAQVQAAMRRVLGPLVDASRS